MTWSPTTRPCDATAMVTVLPDLEMLVGVSGALNPCAASVVYTTVDPVRVAVVTAAVGPVRSPAKLMVN